MAETQSNSTTAQEQFNTSFPAPAVSIIDRAEQAAIKLEAANKKAEELLNRNEAIAARILLSGRAEAGTAIPMQTDKEKALEEARTFIKMTGLKDPFGNEKK